MLAFGGFKVIISIKRDKWEKSMKQRNGWFKNLSGFGKAGVITLAVIGGLTALGAMLPDPETAELKNGTAVEQPEVVKPVVTTKIETETKSIPFKKQTVKDGSLAKGSSRIKVAGVEGVKTITHTVTLTDGVETDRLSAESVTLEPVTEVTLVGTYEAPAPVASVNSGGGVVKKSRTSICHAPGTTYYSRTKNYTSYNTLQACLDSGGRMPKR